jgi:hypothetical protein
MEWLLEVVVFLGRKYVAGSGGGPCALVVMLVRDSAKMVRNVEIKGIVDTLSLMKVDRVDDREAGKRRIQKQM